MCKGTPYLQEVSIGSSLWKLKLYLIYILKTKSNITMFTVDSYTLFWVLVNDI